jgi:hypothetical protein
MKRQKMRRGIANLYELSGILANPKFKAIIAALILFISTFHNINAREKDSTSWKIGVKLCGGGNYMTIGDLNSDMIDFSNRFVYTLGASMDEEVNPFHLGYNFDAAIEINFSSRFGISVGTGFIKAQKGNQTSFQIDSYSLLIENSPEISAVPIYFNVYFYPLKNIYFDMGVGYYFAQCSYRNHFEYEGDWIEFIGNAKGNGIGFRGKLGFEFPISRNFAFIIEGGGRLAKIKNFKGVKEIHSTLGTRVEERGTLYYYEEKREGNTYKGLTISQNEPIGVKNLRKATVDLSGSTISVGIKIKL